MLGPVSALLVWQADLAGRAVDDVLAKENSIFSIVPRELSFSFLFHYRTNSFSFFRFVPSFWGIGVGLRINLRRKPIVLAQP